MNKIISGLLAISLSPVLITNFYYNQNYSASSVDPTYPGFTEYVNKSISSYAGEKSWGYTDQHSASTPYSVSLESHAKSVNDFFKYYTNIEISYQEHGYNSFGRNDWVNSPNSFSLSPSGYNQNIYDKGSWGAENSAENWTSLKIDLNGNNLDFTFTVTSKAHNGWNSNWTDTHNDFTVNSISFNSIYDLNNVKNELSDQFNKQIDYVSDFSGSIFEEHNLKSVTQLIDNKFKTVLGDDYDVWKQYIYQYSYSDEPSMATLTIRKQDRAINWTFTQKINITLSPQYWGQSLSKRLHIQPGKIVNPSDSTQGMIDDTGVQLEPNNVTENYGGTLKYHTSATIEFDGDPQNDEWLEINGQKIQVLNNKFYYNLADARITNHDDTKPTTYDVVVYHENGTDKAKYEIKYEIASLVPAFNAKWYGWNPDTNPDQEALITPTLPDGKVNPQYDKDVNPKTGTKTQVLWINHKSEYPFALDPLNQEGKVISDKNDYDLGFIAEGSVVGKGVQQLFDPKQMVSESREGVNSDLSEFSWPSSDQKLTKIQPDKDNQYWSWEGFWHYITKTDDKLAFEKYVLIGAKYQGKYVSFLDVLNQKNPGQNIAVNFWTTLHGQHLKNYLVEYKQMDSQEIQNLNFEQVSAFWKDYTSDVIGQHIPPPHPINTVDITGNFSEVKMNEDSLNNIVLKIDEEVGSDIDKKINQPGTSAHVGIDYDILSADGKNINKDPTGLSDLLNDKDQLKIVKLKIVSTPASTIIIGTANINILNSKKYDPTKVYDLSQITGTNYEFNYTSFTVEELKSWILRDAENELDKAHYNNLTLNTDYGVSDDGIPADDPKTGNNVPGELNDNLLTKFLNVGKDNKKNQLLITVYAADLSLKTVGSFTFTLINDKTSPPAPPDPPVPPDPPSPKPDFWSQGKNLAWVIIVIVIGSAVIGFSIYYFVSRFKNKKIK